MSKDLEQFYVTIDDIHTLVEDQAAEIKKLSLELERCKHEAKEKRTLFLCNYARIIGKDVCEAIPSVENIQARVRCNGHNVSGCCLEFFVHGDRIEPMFTVHFAGENWKDGPYRVSETNMSAILFKDIRQALNRFKEVCDKYHSKCVADRLAGKEQWVVKSPVDL